jgi:hypothetical protein
MEGTKEPDTKEPDTKELVAEELGAEEPGTKEPDPVLDTTVERIPKIKPSTPRQIIELSQPVEEGLVEIHDELFKKVLFFSLFISAKYDINFSNGDLKMEKTKLFNGIKVNDFLNENREFYLAIPGFVETIFVFFDELYNIRFIKYGFFGDEDEEEYYRHIPKYEEDYTNSKDTFYFDHPWSDRIIFSKKKKFDKKEILNKSLANIDNTVECNSKLCYDIIRLVLTRLRGANNKTYITQQQLDTLRNYVELLEKLITGEIIIKITDGELFANNIKIGYKNTIRSAIAKICKKTFTSSATINMEDDNAKLYDIILSIYRHPVIEKGYNLKIGNKTLCGGRNNKTRKRHRNKTTYKKMRKSHNIRKRKSNGTKRK